MAETAPPGFVGRHNQLIGSLLSVVGLIVAVLLGAAVMFGTEVRGVSAILTLLTIAGGTFTLFLLGLGAGLSAMTPTEAWEREENQWRAGMGLPARSADDAAAAQKARSRTALIAVAAILVGLALSVIPAVV